MHGELRRSAKPSAVHQTLSQTAVPTRHLKACCIAGCLSGLQKAGITQRTSSATEKAENYDPWVSINLQQTEGSQIIRKQARCQKIKKLPQYLGQGPK